MKIETLDRALSLSNEIDRLEDLKKRLTETPPLGTVLGKEFRDFAKALPAVEVLDAAEDAMKKFNEEWIMHIDEILLSLRSEFESL